MSDDIDRLRATIPSSEQSFLLSPTFNPLKTKTLFSRIFNNSSTTFKSSFKNNMTFPLKHIHRQVSTDLLRKQFLNKASSFINLKTNKQIVFKKSYQPRKIAKTSISKSGRQPSKLIKRIYSKGLPKDYLSNSSLFSSSTPKSSFCEILSTKKRIGNIIPKEYPFDKLLSPDEFLQNINTSLIIYQKKLSNHQSGLTTKDVNRTYGTYFTLINGEQLSKEYRVSQKYINVFPERIKDECPQSPKINREKRYSASRALMMNKKRMAESKAYKSNCFQRFKEVIIKAAIQFKQMNIELKDFYAYYYIQNKPFEDNGSQKFLNAVKEGNIEEVKDLLKDNPCLVSTFDHYKQTSLHWATKRNNLPMIMLLIDKWANVNAKDLTSNTPLHIASHLNHFKAVQLLLYCLAKPKLKNKFGLMPYNLAKDKLIRYLIQRASFLYTYHNMGKVKDYESNVKSGLRYLYEEELRPQCGWYRKYVK